MTATFHDSAMTPAEAESRLSAQVGRLKNALEHVAGSGRDLARDLTLDEGWVGSGIRCARRHPVAAVAVAAGIGLLFSRLFR